MMLGLRAISAMVLGRVASPEVTQVELTYDTGQTFIADPQSGVFATFAQASAVCSVNLMDNSGEVLQEFDATSDLILAQPDAADACRD